MGEELLEIEQSISKAKVLLYEIYKTTESENTKQGILRINFLLETYINKIIYLSNDSINHQQIIEIINIKKEVEDILQYIEGILNDKYTRFNNENGRNE